MKVALRGRVAHPVWFGEGGDTKDYYRCRLPARMTGGESRGSLTIAVGDTPPFDLNLTSDTERFRDLAATSEPISIFGLGPVNILRPLITHPEPAVSALVAAINAAGGNLWVDLDDNDFAYSFAAEFLLARRLGLLPAEATVESIHAYAPWHDARLEAMLETLLPAAAGVTVGTAALADVVRPYNPAVTVLEMAIDPADFPTAVHPGDGIVRIGYGGLWHHADNVQMALPALLTAARLPGVELHFFGYHPRYADSRASGRYTVDGALYTYHGEYPSITDYYQALGILDIAVLPLLPTPRNRGSATARPLEHGLHGTALIVSDLPPYAGVQHGITGFKIAPSDIDGWGRHLRHLIRDRELRRRIGQTARADVLRNHTTSARAPQWRAWFETATQQNAHTPAAGPFSFHPAAGPV